MDDSNISTELGEDGILVATIDMPGRSMNVFSADLMDSLERLLDLVKSRRDIAGAVVRSGKPAFLAGADLDMVRMFTERACRDSAAELHELCGRLSRLFRRLETNGKPFVAAINGLALGGGLELALACHARVASEDVQVGLPEVKLGLLPGGGGTQRLPRLTGKSAALQIMLRGEPQPASRSKKLGIVDAVVPARDLLDHSRWRALALAKGEARAPWERPGWRAPPDPGSAPAAPGGRETILPAAEHQFFADEVGLGETERRHYPAYDAILSCVIGGLLLPMDEACRWEMDRFVALIRDPVAGNMVRTLFLNRQRAVKLVSGAASGRPARAIVRGAQADPVRKLLRSAHVEVLEEAGPGFDGLTIVTDAIVNDASVTGPSASDTALAGAPNAGGISVPVTAPVLAWLRSSRTRSPGGHGVSGGVWVSDKTDHGRAVEVCIGAAGGDATPGLEIARWLRAVPLVTLGASLLQQLAEVAPAATQLTQEEKVLAAALAAARAWSTGGIRDTGIADTAAVVAGFLPAYTGGPFTFLKQRGAAAVKQEADAAFERHGAAFTFPERLGELLTADRGEST